MGTPATTHSARGSMASPVPTGPAEEKELEFGGLRTAGAKDTQAYRPFIDDGGRRRSSVQFHTEEAEKTISRECSAVRSKMTDRQRRMSSPPPPATYQRGISFDTFDNKGASTEAFTLNYKHVDYARTPRSRTFLCGTDANDYSEYALEWMLDELVDDDDEIVCLRVVEKDSVIASSASILKGKYREEASKLLESVIQKNVIEEKAISIIMEIAVGRVQDIFQQMIAIYEPAALIVGTRGRNLGGMQGLMPGSVSKYCLQHSPVPVIVVRPSSKRQKKKLKRQQELGKSPYSTILERAQTVGGKHILELGKSPPSKLEASQLEAAAVEKAILTGQARKSILKNKYGGPLARVTSNKSDMTSEEEDEADYAPRFALPIGFLTTESAPRADIAMQSPSIAMLADEDWSDVQQVRPTPRSPAPYDRRRRSSDATSEAVSDADEGPEDEESLGIHKLVEERRPSTRQTTPWLNAILSDNRPRKASRSRSRSRDPSIGR